MTCDVEFLAVVNDALSGTRFNALVITKFEGSLELSNGKNRFQVNWSGWLSTGPEAVHPEGAEGYEYASVIGPMIGDYLSAITHNNGVYELAFASGRSVFAGHFGEVNGADHVLMVKAHGDGAPFTWGLLD